MYIDCKIKLVPDHEVDGGPNGESDEPEPQEDVDLLVDDVDGENAEAVEVLDGSRRTKPLEGALGHLGEEGMMPDIDPSTRPHGFMITHSCRFGDCFYWRYTTCLGKMGAGSCSVRQPNGKSESSVTET